MPHLLNCSRYGRLTALAALLLIFLLIASPAALARGSFGRGGGFGHSFGGGSFRSPSRSYSNEGSGHSFFGGLFGHSRPAAPPAPRPSFTPAPQAAPSPGSFGRTGSPASQASSHFAPSAGIGGSFGRSGAAGKRGFTSVGEHPQAAPPPAAPANIGTPYSPGLAHTYYYRGQPAPAYFSGGFTDYSYGYLRHPYYGWLPWSPVFYYNRPYYANGGYVSGGFSFIRFLIGIVFWVVVAAIIVNLVKRYRGSGVR